MVHDSKNIRHDCVVGLFVGMMLVSWYCTSSLAMTVPSTQRILLVEPGSYRRPPAFLRRLTTFLRVFNMEFATQEKVTEGFDAVGERIDEFEKDVKVGMKELAESIGKVQKQQRLVRVGEISPQASGLLFPNEEHAKEFGENVVAAMRGKAMSETNEGGVLVGSEISTPILNRMTEYGAFRRNAMVVPMGAASTQMPQVTGDLTVYSPGEGGTITESDVESGQVNLVPRKLACLARVSSELEEDSIAALGELVGQSVARSLARAEDLAGFLGDGTATYWSFRGICGALRAVNATIANIKSLVVGSGNTYAELKLSDFRKVIGQLPSTADAGARWYMHKWFFWNVVIPLIWAENAGVPTLGTPNYFEQGPAKYLFGYPCEFTPAMPKAEANSQICAILGDLRQGVILGERKSLTIARSEHVHFASDEVAIRGLERIAIGVYGQGDVTDAGPICGLITAAS